MYQRILANLNIAFEAVLANKLRSMLTGLGIIFGVAAVIAMMAIGAGAQQEILEQIKLVGVNNIVITPVVEQEESELDETEKSRLVAALEASGKAKVRTAFDLAAPVQQRLEEAIKQLTVKDIHLSFEAAPEQVSGIEIFSAGYKTAWSVSEYLSSLDDRVTELLKEFTDFEPETVSAHEYNSH